MPSLDTSIKVTYKGCFCKLTTSIFSLDVGHGEGRSWNTSTILSINWVRGIFIGIVWDILESSRFASY